MPFSKPAATVVQAFIAICLVAMSGAVVLNLADGDQKLAVERQHVSAVTDAQQSAVPIRVQAAFAEPPRQFIGLPARAILVDFLAMFSMGALALIAALQVQRRLNRDSGDRIVSDQARQTLDTLPNGLVVLDITGRIEQANLSFARIVEVDPEALIHSRLTDLDWLDCDANRSTIALPWEESLQTGKPVRARSIVHHVRKANPDQGLTLLVNATPTHDQKGNLTGVIVSFDDITPLEDKKRQLAEMLTSVKESTDQVRRQNEELTRLATYDSLTGCVNRRHLFEVFETEWKAAIRNDHSLACAMIDIDHFKTVNDKYGHSVGDQVLGRISAALMNAAREADVVARYGGEEFCVLLRNSDIEQAHQAAERFRAAVAAADIPNLAVTVSIGVSELSFGATDPQAMIDQADRALYAAKRMGRNRALRWDQIPSGMTFESRQRVLPIEATPAAPQRIPFHAVTALISALAYRDQATAAHCRRVADLAVAAAEGLLGVKECYTLEIGALLHDLGKLGIPDNILLKPDQLTDEEWDVVRRQERIGVEIVRASFAFAPLTEIVNNYRTPFAHGERTKSVGARILAIVDAFDSMISDRPYRPGCSIEEAFVELRKCAGSQFDPALVERVIETVRSGSHRVRQPVSVGKETALSIGLQIEHLAEALDEQDLDRLVAMAGRLRNVAVQHGITRIAETADHLSKAACEDSDLFDVLHSANELLRLCRSTQQSYVDRTNLELPD